MNILDALFPRRCLGCGRIGKYFCDQCRSTIRVVEQNEAICPMCGRLAIDGVIHPRCRTRYGLDGLTSFFHYDGIIQKAVKMLKYRRVSDLAAEFVSLISVPCTLPRRQAGLHHDPCIFVPIPLHPSRQKERGYNQAEILGALIAKKLNIPIATDILKRVKKTVPQVEMKKREARLKNMEGVFAVYHTPPEHVVLFDDVFTTGATMRSAANRLKRAGAKFVWAVTIAR